MDTVHELTMHKTYIWCASQESNLWLNDGNSNNVNNTVKWSSNVSRNSNSHTISHVSNNINSNGTSNVSGNEREHQRH